MVENILFTVGFSVALLFPILLIGSIVVGLYATILLLLYRWSKAVFVIVLTISLVALVIYIVIAWNQYQKKGFICFGENICFDDGRGQHPPGEVCYGDCGKK